MTPLQQRIAIAEACGWKKPKTQIGYSHPEWWWMQPDDRQMNWVPDYLNDLNAMHEAEKMLKEENLGSFLKHLALTTGAGIHSSPGLYTMKMLHATAAQRSEAFLRTLGLWRDQ